MRRFAWLFLAAAVAFGADLPWAPGANGPWSLGYLDSGAALIPAPRTPAYLNWVAPAGPDLTRAGPELATLAHLPGIPREATLSASVEDRYDWFPTYGSNAYRDRPWLRVGSEWTFSRPGTSSFVGIGATVPLASPTSGMLPQDPVVQTDSARGQVAVYAGVRF